MSAAKHEVVFHIQLDGCQGLPRPEKTFVRLIGLGLPPGFDSVAVEESEAPRQWPFRDPGEIVAAAKASAAHAAAWAADPKSKKGGAPPAEPEFPFSPANPRLRLSRPWASTEERQQLLDTLCSPFRIELFRNSTPAMLLASCSLGLSGLIHDTGSIRSELELQWSQELLYELESTWHTEQAAPWEERRAAAETAGEPFEEILPPFSSPSSGRLSVSASTAGPIGRALCPEDLHDWAILSLKIEGCYHLPKKLLEAFGPLPAPGAAPAGPVAEHALRYSVSLLDCELKMGRLALPQVDPSPEAAEPETEEAEAKDVADFAVCDIGMEEFVEGLARAGFVGAQEHGEAAFEYLHRPRTGLGGRLGLREFLRLADIGIPASPNCLISLRAKLMEQHGSLDAAFAAMDNAGESVLTHEDLIAGVGAVGFGADAEKYFLALSDPHRKAVLPEDFRTLGLHYRLASLSAAGRAAEWLLRSMGSVEALVQQADEQKTGTVTEEAWHAAVAKLGYPDLKGATLIHRLLDVQKAGLSALPSLEEFADGKAAVSALSRLEEILEVDAAGGGEAAMARLRTDGTHGRDGLSLEEFVAAGRRLGFVDRLDLPLPLLFFLLDESETGMVSSLDLSAVFSFNRLNRWRNIAECRSFLEEGFGAIDREAFRRLFDDRSEFFSEAEAALPRIEWQTQVTHFYRGRTWLQRLLNTLGDERGRQCAQRSAASGGCWLHFFPHLEGGGLADFKEIQDPMQQGHAKLARWHHAQAFVDLRRLAAPSATPELEFRAFLSQVKQLPTGLAESDLPAAPYGHCQTYIKGTIKLDRPLFRLFPRDVRPPMDSGGEPYIPSGPAKPPPPTMSEELVREARNVVGRLAEEFARMCKEEGLEEPQKVGPHGELSPYVLLGRIGVRRCTFLKWLEEQDGGLVLRDAANDLRPSIVRFVRAENKDGPSCGLSGNENDAKYSMLRDEIQKHLIRALNLDVDRHRRLREGTLWRSPLFGEGFDEEAKLTSKDRSAAGSAVEQDEALCRLALEYEILGDWARAQEINEERLSLPQNIESSEPWYTYARFHMRCGQNQLEAEKALRYAISLRSLTEGPSLLEAAFLAGILLNYSKPCSLGAADGLRPARFEAACALLCGYADKHPLERLPWYFLFTIYGLEAQGVHETLVVTEATFQSRHQENLHSLEQELEEEAKAGEGQPPIAHPHHHLLHHSHNSLSEERQQYERLVAEASKYLVLARTPSKDVTATLSAVGRAGPQFPSLETLFQKEQVNRGEAVVLSKLPEVPAAWQPSPQPVFLDSNSLRREPDQEDLVALDVVDLLLHFGLPSLARFLVADAQEAFGYISAQTQRSDRCQMQLLKAAMLASEWDKVEALAGEMFSQRGGDRIPEAHVIIGECRHRAAKEAVPPESEDLQAAALTSFEAAISFLPSDVPLPRDDPVLHLRVAGILHRLAEESRFQDDELNAKAVHHYQRSLVASPTAEAWRSVGVLAYRRSQRVSGDARKRDSILKEALRYLSEANILDRCRPQINAWLAICSAELGRAQVTKQTLRQVFRFEDRLDGETALELAQVLLRCSDEQQAAEWGGERGRVVQDGRYAEEAATVARIVLRRIDNGQARYALAQALALSGEGPAAAKQFCMALPLLKGDDMEKVAAAARRCCTGLSGELALVAEVEEAIRAAFATEDSLRGGGEEEDFAAPPGEELQS